MSKDQPKKTTKLRTILVHKVQLHPRHLNPESTRSCRPLGPANPPPKDDTTSDEGNPPPREPPTSSQLPAIDPIALTNSLAANVHNREDEIATLQNQIGILLINEQDCIMRMLCEEMDRNKSRHAS